MKTILLSAFFAGSVAIIVTIAIERFGGLLGGFLGTLPTTIVPAVIGIYSEAPTTQAFTEAVSATPIGMLINAGFLFLWRVLPPRLPDWSLQARLGLMVLVSLSGWCVSALIAIQLFNNAVSVGVAPLGIALSTTVLLLVVGVWACLRPLPAPKGDRRVNLLTLLSRGLLAAVAIGFSVWLSAQGGKVTAGLASTFPAIFVTTMVSLWLAQGEAVPIGAVGPMMLGSTSVAAYSLLALYFFQHMPPAPATLLTWMGAVCLTTVPLTLWLRRRRLRQAQS